MTIQRLICLALRINRYLNRLFTRGGPFYETNLRYSNKLFRPKLKNKDLFAPSFRSLSNLHSNMQSNYSILKEQHLCEWILNEIYHYF